MSYSFQMRLKFDSRLLLHLGNDERVVKVESELCCKLIDDSLESMAWESPSFCMEQLDNVRLLVLHALLSLCALNLDSSQYWVRSPPARSTEFENSHSVIGIPSRICTVSIHWNNLKLASGNF